MVILSVILVWFLLHLFIHPEQIRESFVIGHRGAAAQAPENTIAGVRKAIELGADFVEIDVQRSADGDLVVMHDRTVDRTTNGTGPVAELSTAALQALDAGSSFSADFAGERVPTLDEMLSLVENKVSPSGGDFTLAVEVKDPENFPGIAEQIAQTLAERQVEDQVIVLSFDHDWLLRFRSMAPEVRVVPIWFSIPHKPPPQGTAFVSVWWPIVLLDPTLVARTHRQGYPVLTWTVNQAWQMRLLHWLGVDGFATDDPEIFNRTIK